MYTLTVKRHFDAAHFVRGYDGNCANIHGHRWFVVLKIECEELDRLGMAVDFRKVKASVKPALERLDHTLLNDHPTFAETNPTTENLSRFLFEILSKELSELGVRLGAIEVWESDDCGVSYTS